MNLQLNWMNYLFLPYDGYGLFGLNMVLALASQGVDVLPLEKRDAALPGWMQHLRGIDWGRLNILLMPPHELPDLPGRSWAFTMTEGYYLSREWVRALNDRTERVLVPSDWLVDVFVEHGVTRPIHVIPGGVNPGAYPVMPHSPRSARPYTFMAFADRGGRKGVDAVMRAFIEAFSPVSEAEFAAAWDAGERTPDLRLPDDVALVMKVRPDNVRTKMMNTSDPHIRFLAYDAPHMSAVYPLADCVVVPSKGEGWGFFGREAACMGVPVIASNWTGHAPDAPNWATVSLEKSKLTPSVDESLVLFHEPDMDELVAAMRWCYEHRAEARQKAAVGAQWLRDHQTWTHSANALLTLLTEYL